MAIQRRKDSKKRVLKEGEYERSIRVYEEEDRLTYGNGECELKNLD